MNDGIARMHVGKSELRIVTIQDVDNRLRSAGDFIGAMANYETQAIDVTKSAFKSRDFSAQAEALRKFQREFEAFIAESRTAWNYMNVLADAARTRAWLDARLQSKLCKMHREVANNDTHRMPVIFGIRQTIGVSGKISIPRLKIEEMLSLKMPLTVTDFRDIRLHYEPKNLVSAVQALCAEVLLQHPNETVVELSARYWGILRQVLRSGARAGRFATSGPVEPKSGARVGSS